MTQALTTGTDGPRVEDLIQSNKVHGSLYTDPAIFAKELRRIWSTTWVFVGHESEVPEPNDYVRKKLGTQDVILTRDRDGDVHLLFNRCAHRGLQVCDDPKGNSSSFRCPYHGWTYRNTGELLGYPYNKGYGGKGQLGGLGMERVPRVASYQGFVFGSLAHDGPSLIDHLGAAASEIDRLIGLSPKGRVTVADGWVAHTTRSNWKFLVENETDGYHPQFVHGSIFTVTGSPLGPLYTDSSAAVTRSLGNGHSEIDPRPEYQRIGEPMRWFGTTPDRVPRYVAAMQDAYGDDAQRRLLEGPPHVMVFPNLFIAEIQLFNIQPVSASECVQYSTALQFDGGEELNRRMVSQAIGSIGPAGMLLADDTVMYERNQRGVEMLNPEWLDLRRGLGRERIDENGFTVGASTDETAMRGFWRHYKSMMGATS